MKIAEITSYIESIAPLQYQETYDNAGLITGNHSTDVNGILICLDSTEEVLDEAIAKNCNLIIAHHPIIFGGLKKLNGKNYVERVIIKAIKNEIAIYCAHTNLDNVITGVNFKIAEKLGLLNCNILSPKTGLLRKLVTFCPVEYAEKVREALFNAGAGNIGNYDECSFNSEGFGTFRASDSANPFVGDKNITHREKEVKIETIYPSIFENKILAALHKEHPYEEVAYDVFSLKNNYNLVGSGMIGELPDEQNTHDFLLQLKKKLSTDCIRHTAIHKEKVKKIAVCGGAGSFLLNDAIAAGADVFITSDFKYHQFFDAENRIVIADVGHYESEQFTKELFLDLIKKKFPTFAALLSAVNTNPINYI